MKHAKKLASLLLVLVMAFALSMTAFAAGTTGSITIENASKGETYTVVKLFDASVTGKEGGSIVYTGTIPDSLKTYFAEVDGYIQATDAAKAADGSLSEAAVTAMKEWAEEQKESAGISKKGTGGPLTFDSLSYGYYAVLTSQGAAISVTSTNPDAKVYDKNTTEPGITKAVDDPDDYIGQTVTYTLTAETSNYLGQGANSEIVTQYVIKDTLPEYLADVTVTKITIGGNEYKVNDAVPQFANKEIVIPWATKGADGKYTSIYDNGAKIIITYTAKVTDKAVVDGAGNKNTVTLTAYTTPNDGTTPPDPWNKTWSDDEIIYTYAAALKKVDENKAPLAGAKFAANGLTVTGSKGNYTVTAYDSTSTTPGTEMETDDNGHLVIKGLPSDVTLTVTETVAPAGYNKLKGSFTLTPSKISETVTVTSTTVYYDADGKVSQTETQYSKTTIEYNDNLKAAAYAVENRKGTELPSTGGVGTTIFYVVGGTLVLAAVVLLVTRKRMKSRN